MSVWVKICGNTSLADAQQAAEAGADAVGFVFAPSPRRVTPEKVSAITANLPAPVEKVGVFVEEDFAFIAAAIAQCGLTGVQLYYTGRNDLAAKLRASFGQGLRILRVVHFSADAAVQLSEIGSDPSLNAVLVDSRTATAVGGTGIAFDWQAARGAIFSGKHELRLIAAGGLTPANVAEAIATLTPWGVDIVSGVESRPGLKDPEKVRAFIQNARIAAAGL